MRRDCSTRTGSSSNRSPPTRPRASSTPAKASPKIWTSSCLARERFEFRIRQEREKAEKAAKLAAKAAETRAKLAEGAAGDAPAAEAAAAEDPKKALIAAAMARAKAQKAEVQAQNTDNLSPETQAEIAEIEARRRALDAPTATAAPTIETTAAAPTAGAEPRP